MRFRNTLLLILVLAGLGAYVFYVERPAVEKEAKKEKLVDFQTDDITEIVLTYPDREVMLSKAGGSWKVTKPVEADADEATVKGLLSMLNTAEVKKGLDGEVKELATYGLEKPNTMIAMKAGDKALPVVKIGEAAPIGGSAYALRGDDKKILLTSSSVRSGVEKTLKDLRNKTVFKFSDDNVRKVEVKGEGKDLVLAKSGDQWKIEAPSAHDADPTAVRSLLSSLRALRATDFPDEKADLAGYGLDAPKLTVTLTLTDGAQQTLLVGGGNEKKEAYVKTASSPVVYTVGEWVSRDLNKPADDFRDKTIVAFDKDKVKAIEVTRKDGSGFTLTRGGDGKWSLEKAEGPQSEAMLVGYANDLAVLKGYAIAADGAADLAAFGLEPASARIKVIGPDGAEVGTALLGQREVDGKKEYTAARADGNTVFLVRDYQYTRLDRPASDFGERAAAAAGAPQQVPPGMGAADEMDFDDSGDPGDAGEQPEIEIENVPQE